VLRQRAISAAIFVPPLLVCVLLGQPWIAIVVLLATIVGSVETFRLLRSAGYPALPVLGSLLTLALLVDAAAPDQLAGSGMLLAGAGLAVVAVGSFGRPDPAVGLATWMATSFGAFYAAGLGFVLRLGHAVPALPGHAALAGLGSERAWILLLVFAVWAYDTGAYLAGRSLGRRRFLTHLSASKTWEGLVGGLLAATVVVAVMLWGVGQPPALALILGPLLGLAAQAGDLAESMLKRAAGAKDSGTLIPGHGGMLDRIDSFLLAAPVATIFVIGLVR
jgi:phosphatidate cytidylyltransferase